MGAYGTVVTVKETCSGSEARRLGKNQQRWQALEATAWLQQGQETGALGPVSVQNLGVRPWGCCCLAAGTALLVPF